MIKKAVVIICFCLMLALCSCSLAVNSEASDVAGGISVPAYTDVDLTIASVAVSNDYVVKPGNITPKDIWQLYRYPNRIAVIPMYGYEIRNVMEENAAERLTV